MAKAKHQEKVRADIKVVEKALKNPIFKAQVVLLAGEWVDNSPTMLEIRRTHPLSYQILWEGLLCERAATLLGLDGYVK